MAVLFMILSINLDALAVGFAYGIKNVRIPFLSALVISAFSVFYSAISLVAGSALATVLPPEFCTYAGALLLFIIGVFIIAGAFKESRKPNIRSHNKYGTIINWGIKSLGITISVVRDPSICDFDSSCKIDARESVYLSLALSADAIGVGLGSSLTGITHPFIPILVGLSQIFLLYSGLFAATFLSHKIKINKRVCEIAAGGILILLSALHIVL